MLYTIIHYYFYYAITNTITNTITNIQNYILINILSNSRLTISNISILVILLIIISTKLVSILIYPTLKELILLLAILTLYSFYFIHY